MTIAAKYPSARDAQISRMAEVQERVAEAFAKRPGKGSRDRLTAHILAGLVLCILSITFRTWFEKHQQDVSVTVDQVLARFRLFISETSAPGARTKPGRASQSRRQA
jgi:hypothetical protein